MRFLFKEIYKIIPFKKYIYFVIRFFMLPNEKIFKHLHFNGVFSVIISKTDSFKLKNYNTQIENEIFWKGIYSGWEGTSMTLWIELCKNSKNILDIGANTGIYSLVAKTMNPNSKVFAFEPVESVFEKLKYNIEINKFDTVCVKKAISDKTGVRHFGQKAEINNKLLK